MVTRQIGDKFWKTRRSVLLNQKSIDATLEEIERRWPDQYVNVVSWRDYTHVDRNVYLDVDDECTISDVKAYFKQHQREGEPSNLLISVRLKYVNLIN